MEQVDTFSDHNQIGLLYRLKGKGEKKSDYLKRDRKNWNLAEYLKKVQDINWVELYNSQNVDVANTIFEENLLNIFNEMIPVKKCKPETSLLTGWKTKLEIS